ncbi:hypothetical protein ETU08_06675 [Apibacter muscae]|uniref:hypothetical protein n=1 Tax=Apibacter muscae TaxID=2509004 RepID=UPI0011AD0226|nr:hypothetical protein [Apibacter muscae]TWP29525.1 hypothetical protein ETU08_06675 [Apibacter muscae]
MDRLTFSIQNKKISYLIWFIVLGIIISVLISLKFVKALEFLAISGYSIVVSVSVVLIYLIVTKKLTAYISKFISTVIFKITIKDQIVSVEEKKSNGILKNYTVDVRDIYTIYYNKHVRNSKILSLKIKLVDIHNNTKFRIISSYFE